MTEPLPSEELHHHYRDGVKEVELVIRRDVDTNLTAAQSAIQNELQEFYLDKVLGYFRDTGQIEPRDILRKGISALGGIDQKRFLLQNMMEAVKQEKTLDQLIEQYNKLGLTTIQLPAPPAANQQANTRDIPDDPGAPGKDPEPAANQQANTQNIQKKDGQFLLKKLRTNSKLTLVVMRIVVTALKAVPKLCAIKPTVGFVGFVPSISFALEAELITVSELFDTLMEGVSMEELE